MNQEDQFELQVRRWYSANYGSLDALELWLANSLSEMTQHDQNIYSYKTRIKSVDSLLAKVGRKHDGTETDINVKKSIEQIDDLVGGRVLVYHPSKVLRLNDMFTKDVRRTQVLEITIHSHQYDPNFADLQELTHQSELPCKLILNNTGYSGFHYVLQPLFHDGYYSGTYQDTAGIQPFGKFELQVRTIIQETWSEVQHRLLYKGNMIKPMYTRSLNSQFANLARMLSSCDNLLESLTESEQFAPTKKMAASRVYPEFGDFHDELKKSLAIFEEQKMPISERYQEAEIFFEHYKNEIREYTKDISDKTLGINLELSEYYLKSGHYQEALHLFQKMEQVSREDAWIYLRAAESCARNPEYFDEGRQYIEKLHLLVSTEERQRLGQDMDDVMYHHGALLAQEFQLFDIAEFLACCAVRFTPKDDVQLITQRNIHQLDCKLDLWESLYADPVSGVSGLDAEQHQRFNERLLSQVDCVDLCMEQLNTDVSMNNSNYWSTLARFYYWMAMISVRDNIRQLGANVSKASALMDNCFASISQCKTGPSETQYELANQIRSLQARVLMEGR